MFDASRRRNIKEQEKMIRKIFENLIGLDHPNIVKFHKYWTEMAEANMEKPRVVSLVHWVIGWMVEGMDGWMEGGRSIWKSREW